MKHQGKIEKLRERIEAVENRRDGKATLVAYLDLIGCIREGKDPNTIQRIVRAAARPDGEGPGQGPGFIPSFLRDCLEKGFEQQAD